MELCTGLQEWSGLAKTRTLFSEECSFLPVKIQDLQTLMHFQLLKAVQTHLTGLDCQKDDIIWLMQPFILPQLQNQTVPWHFLMHLQQLKKKMQTCRIISGILTEMQKVSDMEPAICTLMHTKTIGLHSSIFQMLLPAVYFIRQAVRAGKKTYAMTFFPDENFRLQQF